MSETPKHTPSADAPSPLLGTVARLRQAGDMARARALLRVLAAQYPADPRVWRAMADIAETDEDRMIAVRRLADLASPAMTPALGEPVAPDISAAPAPARVVIPPAESPAPPKTAAAVEPMPAIPPPVSPAVHPARLARRYNWVGFVIVGLALMIVLALFLSTNGFSFMEARVTPTPPLPGVATPDIPAPTSAPAATAPPATDLPATTVASATDVPPAATVAPATDVPPTVTVIVPTATPVPTITPVPTLALGTVVTRDTWTYAILRPDHVAALTGAIGSLQPNGRFILALVAVGNGGDSPAVAPADMFVLVDSRGNRYLPAPGASTTYLNTYGRGVVGDLSLEEPIPAGIGNVSVPLLFDVPTDAQGLTLFIAESPAGWPVAVAP